jgi:5'-nucleotidase
MRVLVTNDDGIESPGLRVLAAAIASEGADVLVAAPAIDNSGMGAAIGPLHVTGQVRFSTVAIEGVPGDAFAVEGPPALCVLAACLGGWGRRPDVVVSGINLGANTGRAVLHSGTVGAALTALNFGVPGLAVSQVHGDQVQWASAATLAAGLLDRLAALRPPVVLNLNVPNASVDEIGGPVVADLDRGGTVQTTMRQGAPGVLEIGFADRSIVRPGTDNALLAEGFATLTALSGPHRVAIDLAPVLDHRISA